MCRAKPQVSGWCHLVSGPVMHSASGQRRMAHSSGMTATSGADISYVVWIAGWSHHLFLSLPQGTPTDLLFSKTPPNPPMLTISHNDAPIFQGNTVASTHAYMSQRWLACRATCTPGWVHAGIGSLTLLPTIITIVRTFGRHTWYLMGRRYARRPDTPGENTHPTD